MNIDTSCFKAFQCAVQTLNFTEAARMAGMTQSGVSQHISKLEKEIGSPLFDRVGKKVMLTEAGSTLLEFIEKYNDSVLALDESLQASQQSLKGRVRYAMPASCLLSPHFPILLKEKLKKFPEIELGVDLCSSEEVIQRVLNKTSDFGFVTKRMNNDALRFTEFCDEEYVLVTSSGQEMSVAKLKEAEWITYPGFDVMFEYWAQSFAKNKNINTKCKGSTNSLHVALTMVAHGLGVSVFPRHCVDFAEFRSKLHIHEGAKKCVNTIYIVTLNSDNQPRRVRQTIEAFLAMKG